MRDTWYAWQGYILCRSDGVKFIYEQNKGLVMEQ